LVHSLDESRFFRDVMNKDTRAVAALEQRLRNDYWWGIVPIKTLVRGYSRVGSGRRRQGLWGCDGRWRLRSSWQAFAIHACRWIIDVPDILMGGFQEFV
jgi:hypothetical protein